MRFDFFDEPSEVVEYLKTKKPELHFDYDEIMHYAHNRAFTIAKITRLDLLSDIQTSLVEAQQKGLKFDEWKKSIKPTLAKKGWLGEVSVTNPKTGEIKDIYVGNRRLKNIYNTNMRVSFSQSSYKSAMNSSLEYFRYVAVLDNKTRPTHASYHGLVLKKDDSFWDTHYPPNAWNCRCKVRAYSKKQIEQKGWSVGKAPPPFAHKDWTHNPGKEGNLLQIHQKKAKKIKDSKLKKLALKDRTKIAQELAQRVAIFKGIKDLFAAKKKGKIELAYTDIFERKKPLYISSDTVQSHKNKHKNITAFEYSLIPKMLEGEKRVFVQKDNVYVVVTKLGNSYRLAIKNIKNKNETYVVSLVKITDIKKEIRKLLKYVEK